MTETADCLFPLPLESNNMSMNEGKHYTKMTFHVGMKRSKSSTICFKLTLQKISHLHLESNNVCEISFRILIT